MKIRLKRREPNGRVQRPPSEEREADVVALAVDNRARLTGIPREQCRDQRLGTKFGTLYVQREITADQYAAGERFTRCLRRYRAILSAPSPSARSVSFVMVHSFDGSMETLDDEQIMSARREYEDAYHAIRDCVDWREYMSALRSMANDDTAKLGDLRSALNVLHHLWR